MRRILALFFLALILITGCIKAAIWQYDRYQVRHTNNELIKKNAVLPAIDLEKLPGTSKELQEFAWRKITAIGSFVPEKEFLIRNRYHEGKYGYGVITLFQSKSGEKFWVDRGWVKAGADAKTAPNTQKVDSNEISITGRIRIDSVERQVGGSLFALPVGKNGSQLTKWNSENSIETKSFYLDMTTSVPNTYSPEFPTPLPELSDGPHLAYTFQWLLFAGLVLYALYLVLREDRKNQRAKA